MVERDEKYQTGQCHTYGYVSDPTGKLSFRDIYFRRGTKIYAISVSTPQFLEARKRENARAEGEELGLDQNIMTFDEKLINDFHQLCQTLTSELPFETLAPFVVEMADINNS